MGFADKLKKALSAGLPNYQSENTRELTTVLVAGQRVTSVAGVSHRQDVLKRLGVGNYEFALIAEPSNEYDPKAVMVSVIAAGTTHHIGYLPAGQKTFILIHKLSLAMMNVGELLTVSGSIDPGDSFPFMALVDVPGFDQVTELLKARN